MRLFRHCPCILARGIAEYRLKAAHDRLPDFASHLKIRVVLLLTELRSNVPSRGGHPWCFHELDLPSAATRTHDSHERPACLGRTFKQNCRRSNCGSRAASRHARKAASRTHGLAREVTRTQQDSAAGQVNQRWPARAATASAAVSTRRMRGPSVSRRQPANSASAISSAAKPPSGPTAMMRSSTGVSILHG